MKTTAEIRTRPGRRRDESARRAILTAALAVLQERGYADFALEAVARRAGTGKTTIYRWWPTRAALAVEAFFDDSVRELAFPDAGSAAADFRAQLKQLARFLRGGRGQVLAALIVGARVDRALRAAIVERWVRPRQRWGVERLRRAIDEGECRADLDVVAALDALYSPLYAHLLLGLKMHADGDIDRHCDLLFAALFAGDDTSRSPKKSRPRRRR